MREIDFRALDSVAIILISSVLLTVCQVNAAAPQQQPLDSPVYINSTGLSVEGEQAIRRFRAAPGFKVDLFASEPLMANPVSFAFDPSGRIYLVETHRRKTSVYDIRRHPDWLDAEFTFRTVEDRSNFLKKVLSPDNTSLPENIRVDRNKDGKFDFHDLEVESERIRVIEDRDGDGRADSAVVFADGFNTLVSGVAAGILVRPPNVWFACIPDLWLLRDQDHDFNAESRKSLIHGFGVHIAFGGHDLHGLTFGPDGKIYFSVADRGLNVQAGGKSISIPDTGAVMRCNPDGTEFEVIATGLRNPQELAFDQFGNLWTGDNNGDGGDKARWVYLVEGSESGWHMGWQHLPNLGLWNQEKLWELAPVNTAAYILPPIAHIGHGPAGLAFYPGTGMPPRYENHFFMCDFPGGLHSFSLRQKGAAYEVVDLEGFLSGLYPVDVDFGPEGGAYVADWIEGWEKTGKGRIYRVYDPEAVSDSIVEKTKEILVEGMAGQSRRRLVRLLEHPDRRVRMEAQFALAARGPDSTDSLFRVAERNKNQLARIHAIWALGQIGRSHVQALESILPLFQDDDPEIRAQAAKVAGDGKLHEAQSELINLLRDISPRVRFFAALGLGKLGRPDALEPIFQMIRENSDHDLFVRHAGIMALVWINDMNAIISAAKDSSSSVRLASLLAMRRLNRPEIAMFLYDSQPQIVLEAVRAIYDLPIESALSQVAALSSQLEKVPSFQNNLQRGVDLRSALLRRVINAHYRLGNLENCVSLAELAALPSFPEHLRAEALHLLRDWAKPQARDRLIGLWRPLPERNARGASLALRSKLPGILKSAPDSVRVAAAQCAAQLNIRQVTPELFDLVSNSMVSATARIESMRALIDLKDSRVREALTIALADKNESVRKEATQWFAKLNPDDAIGRLALTLDEGSIAEKQTALQSLSSLKSPIVDRVLLSWLALLRDNDIPRELQFDLLDAAKTRDSTEIKQALEQYRSNRSESSNSFPELLFGGDPEAGRKIFLERSDVACVQCHKSDSEGGEVGPDLKGIGEKRTREYLLESILFPNKHIAENYNTEVVTMKDGSTFVGVKKNETEKQLLIISPEDGFLVLGKDEIQERKLGLSAMPAEIAELLSRREVRDLVEFLKRL